MQGAVPGCQHLQGCCVVLCAAAYYAAPLWQPCFPKQDNVQDALLFWGAKACGVMLSLTAAELCAAAEQCGSYRLRAAR